jgi:hypothetical protein
MNESDNLNGVGSALPFGKPKFAPASVCFGVYISKIRHDMAGIYTIIPLRTQPLSRRQGNRQGMAGRKRERGGF